MNRRTFIKGMTAGLLAAPLAAQAQPTGRVYRVGYLGSGYPTEARDLDAFRQRLRHLGYVEEANLVIESRLAELSLEGLEGAWARRDRVNVRHTLKIARARPHRPAKPRHIDAPEADC